MGVLSTPHENDPLYSITYSVVSLNNLKVLCERKRRGEPSMEWRVFPGKMTTEHAQ